MLNNEEGNVRPGSHGQSVGLDSVDFPALGSRLAGLQVDDNGENRGLRGFNDSLGEGGMNMPYSSQLGQMQDQQRDFAIQKEDFPALPGFNKPVELPNGNQGSSGRVVTDSMFQQGSLGGGSRRKGGLGSGGLAATGGQQSLARTHSKTGTADGSDNTTGQSSAPGSYPEHHFGLLGLLGVLRVDDEHRGKLALGTDLTSLGLNLNSSEPLYINFKSPFAEHPPVYVPSCYSVAPPRSPGQARSSGMPLNQKHFAKYTLETLFYIFYGMPKDAMQVLAAKELYARDWLYHLEMQMWFTKTNQEVQNSNAQNNASVPQYIYFDVSVWDRRLFTSSVPGGLEAGFMKQEVSAGSAQQHSYPQQAAHVPTPNA